MKLRLVDLMKVPLDAYKYLEIRIHKLWTFASDSSHSASTSKLLLDIFKQNSFLNY